jgi:hypothetical protein
MTSVGLSGGASRHVASILFATFFTFALAGCGGASSLNKVSNPPSSPSDITGNWVLVPALSASGGGPPISAYLSSNNGAVSGNAVVGGACPLDCVNGCCGGPFCAGFNGSLSGTIDNQGNLTLGSAVSNGGPVFSMTATASQGQLANGTFNLTGSCPAKGTIAGTEYPTLAGTYSGTLTSSNTGQSFAISETLDQSSALNPQGFFDVNATANLSGYSCVTSATEGTPLDMYSGFLGDSFMVSMNASPGGTLNLSGAISPDGKTLLATYEFAQLGSKCNIDFGTGTLTLQ